MSYCTLPLLPAAKLARELAEVATTERFRSVEEALMDATLLGAARRDYDHADVEIAHQAAAHEQRALEGAEGAIS